MPPRSAGCRRIGAIVQTKATAVTNVTDCKRRFGINWKTATVTGVVTNIITHPKGSRKQASLVVDWNIGDDVKRKEVKITNICLPTNPPGSSANAGGQETEDEEDNQSPVDEVSTENNAHIPLSSDEVDAHGLLWKKQNITSHLNGYVIAKLWEVKNITGDSIGEHCARTGMTPYDYFTWMFPMSHIAKIVTLTNINLLKDRCAVTDASEILRFIGVLVLMSRFEYGPRADLWKTTSENKYIPAPNFGRFMTQYRFTKLRSSIRFSDNGNQENDGGINRWGLVDDFVSAINFHRELFVTPSELICVDESMSRWYGLGGDYIDVGLPTYRALDRKPESGCEIKSSACGRSGIMLRLEIVKSPSDDVDNNNEQGLSHGAAVTKRLVYPWAGTNRIVCGDSYFASVHTARVMYDMGLKFIGVVKTATRSFPYKHLASVPIHGRGKWESMAYKDTAGGCDLAAVVWVDRERRYFIASAGCTLEGDPIYRDRWRRVGDSSQIVQTETKIPQIAETYYKAASMIDRHNRCRQSDLNLEKKFMVNDWSMRVNTSLLGICIVDAWLLYKKSHGAGSIMSPIKFYEKLAEQLIDNTYGGVHRRSQVVDVPAPDVTQSGIGPHLTPTSRKRKRHNGTSTNCALQGRCKQCRNGNKSKYVCSACTGVDKPDFWLCHSDTGRDCFIRHFSDFHSNE